MVRAPDGSDYRVMAAKKGLAYREDSGGIDIVTTLIGWVVEAAMDARAAGRPSWKVGVVCVGRFRERFVHKELLAPGVDPGSRMSELEDMVTSGHSFN
jgi:hypothetical protein